MTIKQLFEVTMVNWKQHVVVNDQQTFRTIRSENGWAFDLNYDYPGENYEEIARILGLKVESITFSGEELVIWAK